MGFKTEAINKVTLFSKPLSMGDNDGVYYPSYQSGADVPLWPENLWPHLLYFSTDHDAPSNPVTGGAGGIWLYVCNGDPTNPSNWFDWDNVKDNAEFNYLVSKPSNPIFRDLSVGTQTETPHMFFDDGTFYMYYHNNDSDVTYDNSPVQNTAVATSTDGINWTKQQITHTYNPRNFTGTGHTGYAFVSRNVYPNIPYTYISRTRFGGGATVDGDNPGFAVWGSNDKLNWEKIKEIPQSYGRQGELQADPDYLSYLFRVDNPIKEGNYWRVLGFDVANGLVQTSEYLINDDFEIVAKPELVIPVGSANEPDEQSTRVPTQLTWNNQKYGIYAGRDDTGELTMMIAELNNVQHNWQMLDPIGGNIIIQHNYDFSNFATIPPDVSAINGSLTTDTEGLKLSVAANSTAWVVFNTPLVPSNFSTLNVNFKGVRKVNTPNVRALIGLNTAINGSTLDNFIINEWLDSAATDAVQSNFWLRWNNGSGNNDNKTPASKYIGQTGSWVANNNESPFAKHDLGVKLFPLLNRAYYTIGSSEDVYADGGSFNWSSLLYPVVRVTNSNATSGSFRFSGLTIKSGVDVQLPLKPVPMITAGDSEIQITVDQTGDGANIVLDSVYGKQRIDVESSSTSTISGLINGVEYSVYQTAYNDGGEIDSDTYLATPTATINNSTVSLTVAKPIFSVVVQNENPENEANINFIISKPIFSVNIENASKNISSSIDFNISKPVFNCTVRNGVISYSFSERRNFNIKSNSTNICL